MFALLYQGDTLRLPVPSWKLPDPDRDFIRSVGPIRERRKKSIQEWPEDSSIAAFPARFARCSSYISDPESLRGRPKGVIGTGENRLVVGRRKKLSRHIAGAQSH